MTSDVLFCQEDAAFCECVPREIPNRNAILVENWSRRMLNVDVMDDVLQAVQQIIGGNWYAP